MPRLVQRQPLILRVVEAKLLLSRFVTLSIAARRRLASNSTASQYGLASLLLHPVHEDPEAAGNHPRRPRPPAGAPGAGAAGARTWLRPDKSMRLGSIVIVRRRVRSSAFAHRELVRCVLGDGDGPVPQEAKATGYRDQTHWHPRLPDRHRADDLALSLSIMTSSCCRNRERG